MSAGKELLSSIQWEKMREEQKVEGSGRGEFEQINTKLKMRTYMITIGCDTVTGMH